MRKIIITFIATTLMLGNVNDVQGQSGEWAVFDGWWSALRNKTLFESNFPASQVFINAYAKASFSIGRFQPFIKIGQSFGMNESSFSLRHIEEVNFGGYYQNRPNHMWEPWAEAELSHSSGSLARSTPLTAGLDFRVVGSNFVRLSATTQSGDRSFHTGLLRRQHLSPNMELDIMAGLTSGSQTVQVNSHLYNIYGRINDPDQSFDFQTIFGGLKLRKNIARGLSIEAGIGFKHKLNASSIEMQESLDMIRRQESENVLIPSISLPNNTLTLSVGIHKQFGDRQVQQPSPQARPRVAPIPRHRQVQPQHCPHMRQRSWDRPSSVFNHPTTR